MKFLFLIAAFCLMVPSMVHAQDKNHIGVIGLGGSGMGSIPYLIAEERGWLKEIGVNGIFLTAAGGPSILTTASGTMPYNDASFSAAIAASARSTNLVLFGVTNDAMDINWVVKKDSHYKSFSDLRGKKIAYSVPNATSHVMAKYLLAKHGMQESDVTLINAGNLTNAVTFLLIGHVDATAVVEPIMALQHEKFRVIYRDDQLPRLVQNIGLTTKENWERERERICTVMRVRARAVKYLYENPGDAAVIANKLYAINPEAMQRAVARGVKLRYWSDGKINPEDLDRTEALYKGVGAMPETASWRTIVAKNPCF